LYFIERANSLFIGADHSDRENEREGGVVFLAGRGSGKRD